MRREMDHRFYGEEHDASQEALQLCGYFLCVRVVCFDDNNQAVIPDGFSRQGVHHGPEARRIQQFQQRGEQHARVDVHNHR